MELLRWRIKGFIDDASSPGVVLVDLLVWSVRLPFADAFFLFLEFGLFFSFPILLGLCMEVAGQVKASRVAGLSCLIVGI